MLEKIPNKIDDSIYGIYTGYEKDNTKPYTTILGCRVSNLDNISAGMPGKTFEEANYAKQIAKGNILQGMFFEALTKIWNSGIKRTYTATLKCMGKKHKTPKMQK